MQKGICSFQFLPPFSRSLELKSSSHLPIIGPNVAAKILRRLGPSTEELILYFNDNFGIEGLRHLVKGMLERKQLVKQPVWELKVLNLSLCGLEGASE